MIYENLKKISIKLRKERNPIAAAIVFALSEIEKVGKNNGNRATTEDEAVKVVQKLIAVLQENLKVASEDKKIKFQEEIDILKSVLPEMVSEDEIKAWLAANFTEIKIPEVMKLAKATFGSRADMAVVSRLAKKVAE